MLANTRAPRGNVVVACRALAPFAVAVALGTIVLNVVVVAVFHVGAADALSKRSDALFAAAPVVTTCHPYLSPVGFALTFAIIKSPAFKTVPALTSPVESAVLNFT